MGQDSHGWGTYDVGKTKSKLHYNSALKQLFSTAFSHMNKSKEKFDSAWGVWVQGNALKSMLGCWHECFE